MTKPSVPSSLQQAGDVFEALGSAQGRAAEAMKMGRISYDPRLGFAQQNLLECWLFYTALTRMPSGSAVYVGPFRSTDGLAAALRAARKIMKRAIVTYRFLKAQQRANIIGRIA